MLFFSLYLSKGVLSPKLKLLIEFFLAYLFGPFLKRKVAAHKTADLFVSFTMG